VQCDILTIHSSVFFNNSIQSCFQIISLQRSGTCWPVIRFTLRGIGFCQPGSLVVCFEFMSFLLNLARVNEMLLKKRGPAHYSTSCFYYGHLFMGTWQSIPMDKQQQPPHVKHDRPICEKCQAANIRIRPDGSYSCNHCGYDSTKGRKK
jgi:hypothetical protein